jgi:dipeptidyl aminopeptidase/acylaminoacyl peptidase
MVCSLRLLRLALLAPLLLALPSLVMAQGSAEDYERAAALRHEVRGKVRNASLEALWLHGGELLYRYELADGGWQFRRLAPPQTEPRPAFDHEQVAAQLAGLLGRRIDSQHLPIDRFVRREAGLLVLLEDELRAALIGTDNTVAAVPIQDAAEFHLEPVRGRRSRDHGGSAEVLFVNGAERDVEVIWLDRDGGERRYATLAPGERHRQSTYAGHLWLIRSGDAELGRYRAGRGAGLVLIKEQGDAAEQHAPVDDAERISTKRPEERQSPDERISPDGRYRAAIEDFNLVVRSAETGEETLRTSDGSADDQYGPPFTWSPDSTKLVALQTIPPQERTVHLIESAPGDRLQPRLHGFDYLKPGDRIAHPRPRLFNLERRAAVPIADDLFANPWSIGEFAFAPNSGAFTFLYNQRGHQALRLIEVDAATGAVRALIDETTDTFIDYSNKTFLRRLDATNEIIWMSERDGWNHLYLIDGATGDVKHRITQGEWLVRSVERVDEAKRQVWFRAMGVYPEQDPYHVHFGRVNFDGTGLTWLTASDGTHELRFSPRGDYYIDSYSRVDLSPVHELRRTDDGSLVCELARGDAGELLATGWLPPERFVAKGRHGATDIWGVIFYPSNFDPTRSYPVIENIYAGPHSHFVPKSFSAWHGSRAIAELGFIVVRIDGMGTNWRSKRFHDVCWRNLGDSGFADRIKWITAAAETRPFMDLTRVGIYGGSAGGQSALRALLAHGDFYHAGVADCGCHDNRMDKIWWNEAWMGYPVGPHYEEQSNVTQAHRLTGELLLIVGELDRNVDPASTMQVVDALIKADKDFELLVMPGVGHGAAETNYGKRRRADFFVRHLLDRTPRWTSDGADSAAR